MNAPTAPPGVRTPSSLGDAPSSPATGGQTPPRDPIYVVLDQGDSGAFWKWASAIGWTALGICVLLLIAQSARLEAYFDTTAGLTEAHHSGAESASDKIAIITISGPILDGDGFVKKQIDRVRKDKSVKAVVVRVNSPGGTIHGSDFILHHLEELRKERQIPLVVSMGGVAASGGYYVSMAVGDQKDCIFAEPSTTTGSIGVIIPHYDLSGLLEEWKVKDDSIASHPRKQLLAMTRPISEDHRQVIQAYLDAAFTQFKEVIKRGRPGFAKEPERLDKLATGEIFTAAQAKDLGLIDRIGFIEAAIERAAEMAKLPPESYRVVKYSSPTAILESIGLAESRGGRFDLETVIDLTTPRAYYLYTMLPPLMAGRRE